MVPGCECNGKRDWTFVRIQKFGEESGALATGNRLVAENNLQIFYSPHRHNTHTHTHTNTHMHTYVHTHTHTHTHRHTHTFQRESTCLSNARKKCRDSKANRAFLL